MDNPQNSSTGSDCPGEAPGGGADSGAGGGISASSGTRSASGLLRGYPSKIGGLMYLTFCVSMSTFSITFKFFKNENYFHLITYQ